MGIEIFINSCIHNYYMIVKIIKEMLYKKDEIVSRLEYVENLKNTMLAEDKEDRFNEIIKEFGYLRSNLNEYPQKETTADYVSRLSDWYTETMRKL